MTPKPQIAAPLLLSLMLAACSPPPVQPTLALTGGTVINVRDGSRIADATVLVEGGRISRVGPGGDVQVPSQAMVVAVTGKYVIPGLWDLHTHIQNPRELEVFIPLFIAHGILGIRDMGGLLPREFRKLGGRQAYMPHVVACGTYIDGTAPAGVPDAAIVDELAEKGVDCIKVGSLLSRDRFFAIASRARERGLPLVGHVPVAVSAGEASDAGMRTMEHLWEIRGTISTRETELRRERVAALARRMSPADTELVLAFPPVEPLTSTWSDAKASTLFKKFVANHTWQTATLINHEARLRAFRGDSSFWSDPHLQLMPRDWVDAWRPQGNQFLTGLPTATIPGYLHEMEATHRAKVDLVRRMHDAGVGFLAGTDVSNWNFTVPGASLHSELLWFTQAGLTPLEALQTATINPAEYLGIEDSSGTVEAGKRADLLVLDADPTVSIANTRRIVAVVLGGHLIDRHELNAMLLRSHQRASEVPQR
jgi:hypothetical protein